MPYRALWMMTGWPRLSRTMWWWRTSRPRIRIGAVFPRQLTARRLGARTATIGRKSGGASAIKVRIASAEYPRLPPGFSALRTIVRPVLLGDSSRRLMHPEETAHSVDRSFLQFRGSRHG